jgi:hypothetical protein
MMRKSGYRRIAFVLAASLSLFPSLQASASANDQIIMPTGSLRNADLADLKPHQSNSKTYNEIWTYHIFLDGNVQAYLNFSRVNLGSFKAPVCGADLTLLGFKGKNYSVAREYEKKNFMFTDSLNQLQVHEKIWFRGKLPECHHLHFATTKRDVSYLMDLEFTDIEQGKVWGDGMFRFGGSDAIGIFIHIPNAKVSGTLAVNGDTLHVTGRAYMDHTFQTDMAPDLVKAGYRYISQSGPLEVGYFLDPASGFQSKPVGYGLRRTANGLALIKPAQLKALSNNKPMGIRVPTSLEIHFQDSTKSVVQRGEDRLQQSTLHEFSGFSKMAIKSFMGGEIFTFKGFGTLNGSQPIGYNYFIVD